jgi:hypothetical protein
VENWLLAACDPQASGPGLGEDLAPGELACALAAAQEHFVLGAVLQSMGRWRAGDDAERAALARPFVDHHLRETGRTLALRQLAELTVQALKNAGIPSCVLKGADFAKRLYPSPALRPYRDVDLLVPRAAYHGADRAIRSLGFEALAPERKYAFDDYGQISYLAPSAERWSLELHWNVINSPSQRRQCSITWDDLDFETAPSSSSPAHRLTPTSMLLLAAVHACIGHRFDSLQQLCDIRQICRGAAGPVDVRRLAESCRRLRCQTPVAWSLGMLERAFRCPAGRELADSLPGNSGAALRWGLLGRQTLLRPQSAASKLRRSLARLHLKNAA